MTKIIGLREGTMMAVTAAVAAVALSGCWDDRSSDEPQRIEIAPIEVKYPPVPTPPKPKLEDELKSFAHDYRYPGGKCVIGQHREAYACLPGEILVFRPQSVDNPNVVLDVIADFCDIDDFIVHNEQRVVCRYRFNNVSSIYGNRRNSEAAEDHLKSIIKGFADLMNRHREARKVNDKIWVEVLETEGKKQAYDPAVETQTTLEGYDLNGGPILSLKNISSQDNRSNLRPLLELLAKYCDHEMVKLKLYFNAGALPEIAGYPHQMPMVVILTVRSIPSAESTPADAPAPDHAAPAQPTNPAVY